MGRARRRRGGRLSSWVRRDLYLWARPIRVFPKRLGERGRIGSSSMNIGSQSFDTFGGLPIGHFNDLQISMIPKGGIFNTEGM